jgi:hypothetical protein
VIWTDAPPIAMQGREPIENSPRANTAATINGTAEAKILKRNMIRPLADKPEKTPGLWLAECKQNSLPARSRANATTRLPMLHAALLKSSASAR